MWSFLAVNFKCPIGWFCNLYCFAIGVSLCGVLLNNCSVLTKTRMTWRPSLYGVKSRHCCFMCLRFVLWTCCKISTSSALVFIYSRFVQKTWTLNHFGLFSTQVKSIGSVNRCEAHLTEEQARQTFVSAVLLWRNFLPSSSFHRCHFIFLLALSRFFSALNWFLHYLCHLARFSQSNFDLWKPCANRRNIIVGQQLRTLLEFACCVRLHTLLHVVVCCWELLRDVWNQSDF